MKKRKIKILKSIILAIILLLSFQTTMLAHSGRTDSNGGHKDNNNKSGLGSYHYHCGGYPPHLHTNGVCPYKSSSSTTSSSSNTSKSTKSSTTSTQSTTQENKTIEVTSVQINNKEKNILKISESLELKANIEPSNASNKTITWTSSNTNIATVNSSGKVEAIQDGKVKITAKSNNGKEDSIELTIEKPIVEVTKIVLDKNNISLNEGETVKITPIVYPLDATDKTVTFESLDESIAKVEDGKVTAVKEGTTTIVATASNGIKSICSINVKRIMVENDNKENSGNTSAPVALGALTLTGGGAGIGYLAYKNKGKH